MLNREDILKLADEIKVEKVDIGNNKSMYLKEMTGTERDNYEQSLMKFNNNNKVTMTMENARAKLLVIVISDEEGKRLFKDADVAAVGKLPARIIDISFNKAQRMNGITKDDIEELVKN